jgi:hypothetical protein
MVNIGDVLSIRERTGVGTSGSGEDIRKGIGG